MKNFSSQTIQDFLEELGSSSPAPGGGSVAAISAALASRLTEMVANLTVGREKFAENQETMSQALDTGRSLSNDFMQLAQRDTEAFDHFMKALSLPKETEKDRKIRKDAMQSALMESTRIPLEVIELTRKLSANSLTVALLGNPNAITDAAVAAILAEAAAKGAAMNARINMTSIDDAQFIRECSEQMDIHLEDIANTVKQVFRIADSKINVS